MVRIIHPLAGAIAMLTIATFWLSTAASELFGSRELIVAVKSAIPWGFLLLIPSIAAAGGSGIKLASGNRAGLLRSKLKRMPFVAANGLLVLIPSALFLASKAKAGDFDTSFYAIQALELLAGPVNLMLLGLNMRDGLKLTGRLSGSGKASQEVRLLAREVVAENTLALRFSKPDGFVHTAGQWLRVLLIDPAKSDAKGNSRTFTIASAPHEPELTIATRVSDSAFKQVLKKMPLGSTLRVSGANGQMTLHQDPARPAVFLAGGIGITPFLSMIRDAAQRKLSHRIVLFYANRRPEDAAFLDELLSLEKRNPNFQLVASMSSTQGWQGEAGSIDAAMLQRHLTDLRAPIYYIAGPGGMVVGMQKMLSGLNVVAADIRHEAFYGY